jgi:hypothetical protein
MFLLPLMPENFQDAQTGLFCLSGSSGLSGLTKQTRQAK